MTDEEKKAKQELAKLRKAATKLGVVFTDETPAAELAALVDEAKAKADEEKKAKQTEFAVYTSVGGYVRTYSLADHGEDAEKLAHQFAGKIGGSVR